jgi:cytochrome c-type biogenesis protein
LKYSGKVMKIGGGLLVAMGVLLFTDKMTSITIWFNSVTPDWLKF